MNGRTIVAILSLVILAPLAGDAQTGRKPVPGTRLDALCRIFNCAAPPPAPPPPQITKVQGSITPGGRVLVEGSGFGTKPGGVRLIYYPGYVYLTELTWHDMYISGTVPPVSGVPDKQAEIQVVTGERYELQSNRWPVAFVAKRDPPILLPGNAVRVVQCPDNRCNANPAVSSRWTLSAVHLGPIPASGTDVYSVTLKNGWVLDHFFFSRHSGGSYPFDFVKGPKGFTCGAASATLIMEWGYGTPAPLSPLEGGVVYELAISIIGPSGVPYQ